MAPRRTGIRRDPGPVDPAAWAVILAGGSGTRFWPLSRRRRPKQFLPILGQRTLLRSTWERAARLVGDPARILVVTTREYARLARAQLPEVEADNLLAEPQGRNTAPAVAWSAAVVAARDPGAVMLVLPADHYIGDEDRFADAMGAAAAVARAHGALVTFGVPPTYPETGYGYIELGAALSGGSVEAPAYRVRRFREKPDLATAERYLRAGRYLWNSGMFVWTVGAIVEALDRHLPGAVEAAREMAGLDPRSRRRGSVYARMPATSIDYGVMEHAENAACVRASFPWSDVGSWAALRELWAADADGNRVRGQVLALDARDNVVHAEEGLVALLGVENLAVVRAGDVLLVAAIGRSQDVRKVQEQLRRLGLARYL